MSSPSTQQLLVYGDYVWTGDELLANQAVLCHDGRVAALGPADAMRRDHSAATVVGGAGTLVVPGFVNPHHHGNGVTSFARGVADDALEPWLNALSEAPPVDAYLDTLWAALSLLAGGYTTVGLFQSTMDPRRTLAEAQTRVQACLDAGLRVAIGPDLLQQHVALEGSRPVITPVDGALSATEYIDILEALREQYAHDPRVTVFAAPAGPQWVTDETWEALGTWTLQNGVPMHTHCLESPFEAEYARVQYGSAVKYLADRGALHRHTALVHGVYLTDEELAIAHDNGAKLVTNPGSNLRLRCGISPVLDAIGNGITVALANDSCSLGESDDALAEMRLLYYLQRGPGTATPALTWQQPWQYATQNAAAVLPWGDAIGTLRPGAWADMVVIDIAQASDPWMHPRMDPRQIALQRADRHHLVATIVNGRQVYDGNEGPLLQRLDDVAGRIANAMADGD